MKVNIRIQHRCSVPQPHWCQPVGWTPANIVEGREYQEGAWWDDHEAIAGLVVYHLPPDVIEGDIVEVPLDDLRVVQCGDVRVLEKVKVATDATA